MEPLPCPLIQLPAPWDSASSQRIQNEAQDCFSGQDKSVTQLSLISVGGIECQDLPMSGPLKETEHLKASPYLRYVLTCITFPLGRVCLFKSGDTSNDTTDNTKRIRSPLYQNSTYPLIYQTLSIPIGNEIVLVVEVQCVWNSLSGLYNTQRLDTLSAESIKHSAKQVLKLATPALDILRPVQIKCYLNTVLLACQKHPQYKDLDQACNHFIKRWKSLYAVFKHDYSGEWSYQSALNSFRQTVLPLMRSLSAEMTLAERQKVTDVLQLIDTQLHILPVPPQRINRQLLLKARGRKQLHCDLIDESAVFDRPIFIVSAPRAGSTLLFETLSQFPEIWSTGEENHASLENIHGLHPKDHGFESNRLDERDANEVVAKALKKAFLSKLHNRDQCYFLEQPSNAHPEGIRFLEKTPKNALRIPFFKAVFPDALFVYLQRDYKSNVSSLIDGWRSHQFVAYKDVPGFENRHWKFLLIPKWQQLHDRSIASIAHQQWRHSNQTIQRDLSELPNDCWMSIDYQDLILQPETVARQFAKFAELAWDDVIQARCEGALPVSQLTLSAPQANKWKKHACFLENLRR